MTREVATFFVARVKKAKAEVVKVRGQEGSHVRGKLWGRDNGVRERGGKSAQARGQERAGAGEKKTRWQSQLRTDGIQ